VWPDAFFGGAARCPITSGRFLRRGAFNAAFVPAYAHVAGERNEASAPVVRDRIFTLLFGSHSFCSIVAWFFMRRR